MLLESLPVPNKDITNAASLVNLVAIVPSGLIFPSRCPQPPAPQALFLGMGERLAFLPLQASKH